MRTLQQQFAAEVYERICRVPEADATKYGTMAMKLPVMVRSAGLVQALAFVEAKKEQALLDDLSQVVLEDNQSLLERSRAADLSEYMYLTRRTLLALEWFKRYAQSVLKVEPTDDAEGG